MKIILIKQFYRKILNIIIILYQKIHLIVINLLNL